MGAGLQIKVQKTGTSRLGAVDFNQLPFGKIFTDHVLVARYSDGQWQSASIEPYGKMAFEPSMAALHYGQAIFEGIKAYRQPGKLPVIFRPKENFKRFNNSAVRMNMPTVPEELFLDGMKQLIHIEQDWIPTGKDHSLYIRPFMFATDEMIGVKPSDTYIFMILLSPSGPYYTAPMKICVEDTYTRAAPGGVGFAKNAGNYGGSLYAVKLAKEKGYDQVLWTDAFEHKWLQEVGTMNVFFVIDGKAITPSLEEGTILEGVTRDSALRLLKAQGVEVEERKIHIDELVAAYGRGTFTEAFGTGTAVTISQISELSYHNFKMAFDLSKQPVSKKLKADMDAIKSCEVDDVYGWLETVGEGSK